MYAIIKTGGKQLKVEVGQAIYIEKLDAEAGDKVTFDEIVFVGGEETKIGAPFVTGASVEGLLKNRAKKRKSLLSNTREEKIHTVSKVIVNLIQK